MNRSAQTVEPGEVQATCPEHGALRTFQFRGPWFKFDEAAAYVSVLHPCGCPNPKAFYDWRVRHGVIAQSRRVSKADLDRAITWERKRGAVSHGR